MGIEVYDKLHNIADRTYNTRCIMLFRLEYVARINPAHRKATIIIQQNRRQYMGDGIGGPVLRCMTGNAFEMNVTHYRKDNKEDYDQIEKIIIAKVDNPDDPQYEEKTQADLERALKGKFVTCNVQYRDEKTDALVCNVFVQKPPEGF